MIAMILTDGKGSKYFDILYQKTPWLLDEPISVNYKLVSLDIKTKVL